MCLLLSSILLLCVTLAVFIKSNLCFLDFLNKTRTLTWIGKYLLLTHLWRRCEINVCVHFRYSRVYEKNILLFHILLQVFAEELKAVGMLISKLYKLLQDAVQSSRYILLSKVLLVASAILQSQTLLSVKQMVFLYSLAANGAAQYHDECQEASLVLSLFARFRSSPLCLNTRSLSLRGKLMLCHCSIYFKRRLAMA